MNKKGKLKTHRQMDTLDTGKSNHRRQTVGGCAHVQQHRWGGCWVFFLAEVMACQKYFQWA